MSESPPRMAERTSDAVTRPPATDRLQRDGVRAFTEGDYAQALRHFRQAALVSPENLEIQKDVAHAHLHLGEADEAFEIYRRVWDAGGQFVDLAYNLALLHLDRRGAADAARLLRAVAEQEFEVRAGRYYLGLLFPSTSVFVAECCLYLGIAARERGRLEGAVEHLQRAIELNPSLLSAHHLLADCFLAERRWEQAIDKCRELAEKLPPGEELVEIWIKLAIALFENGQTQDALRELHHVLAQDPGNTDARFHLERFEERLGLTTERHVSRRVDSTEVASPLFGLTSADSLIPGLEESELVIIGQSQTMRRVMRHARLAAASDATVLITGENGTGKELVARAIYLFSPRRDQPIITVNCAALPETLLESELFGHERGAFTGAHAQKMGRFELADGGTIFLDEIGEMSLALQVKLLRVLQEKEFTRVGGTETLHVDVRIIAATNQDLQRMVAERRFREDLFFRLNVLPITIPPLRERREDIPLLVEHLLRRFCASGRTVPTQFGREELEILMDHPWPGNVRELENFLERAVVMGHAGPQLMEEIHRLPRRDPRPVEGEERDEGFQVREELSLDALERAYIFHVLERTGGNQRRAADALGISPSTLWRKMKRYQAGRPGKSKGP